MSTPVEGKWRRRRSITIALRILNYALLFATLIFVGTYVANNWPRLRAADFYFDYRLIGLAIFLTLFYQAYYACGWLLSLRLAGAVVSPVPAVGIWGFSLFGKYLPGKVATLAYRTLIITLQGKATASQVVLAFGLEAAGSILGGLAAATLALAMTNVVPGGVGVESAELPFRLDLLVLLLLGALVLSSIGLYRPVRAFFFRLLRLDMAIDTVTWWRFLGLVLYYLGGWLILGSILMLTIAAVDNNSISFFQSVLAYSLAGLSGMLSVIAPSGFGVRDGVLTLLLSANLTPAIALAISLVARIVATIGDAISISVGFAIIRIMRLETLPINAERTGSQP